MRVDEYTEHDATGLAQLIRRGDVTAAEVYAAAIKAIGLVNPKLNAVVEGPWERPLDHAVDAPFSGVPFVVKDLGCHLTGIPHRLGTRLTGRGVEFPEESYLHQRFRTAGLAMVATTTVPEFGINANCEAVATGSTHNPWDLTRSAGGSSGGTGALVAAGAVPVGHANDGGGSIRIPAAFNGLVGLKPSRGRISDGPDLQERLFGYGMEFAHTRTMRDCAALLDAVAGAMPGDEFIIKEPNGPWSKQVGADPGRLRVAILTGSWAGTPVDREVVAAVEAAGHQLEALGHHVEQAAPRFDWDAFISGAVPIFAASVADSVDSLCAKTGNRPCPETLEHTTLALYEHGRTLTMSQMMKVRQEVNTVRRTVGEFFAHWDLLITPTTNVPAPPLGYLNANDPTLDAEGWVRRVFDVCSFTGHFNWTGTPAMSLPLGWTSAGLPIGVQLAGPMCEEARLIQVGSQLEEAMPWRERRPSVHAANS